MSTRFPARRRFASSAAALVSASLVLAACAGSAERPTLRAVVAASPTTSSTTAPVAAPSSTETPSTTASTSTSTSTSTTVAPTSTTEAPTTTTEAPLGPEPAGPLQAGSRGSRTEAIQQALADQHFDPGPADGAFGGQVTMAVWAFQALRGLPQDGVVSPELEAQILARSPQPMLRPALGPNHTEVDLTRQVLIVWRDGAPVLITHVSSGSGVPYCEETDEGENCGDATTPTGRYRYQRRIEGWRDAPLGRLYNPVYFNGGIAVHGAPSVPDHPASHGCVRIPMSTAEYFPALVANGDTIEVFRS